MSEGGEIPKFRGTEDSVPAYLNPGYHSPDGGKTWYVTESKYPESWMQQAQYYQQAFDREATCMAGYMFHQHLLKPSRWRRFKNWLRELRRGDTAG